jgi:hypothetical protein
MLPGRATGDDDLAGAGITALPDSEEVGAADGPREAQLVGAQAVPGAGVLARLAAAAEVVVSSSVLTTRTRQVVGVAGPIDSGDLVNGHHPQDKYPPRPRNP